ncbi:HisA/HisF-related TIM barrel protein [Methyloversatilis discipulorum]|uniref:HisA/HisF-related TIM barrel protein n=1 Tax=Methyloversatilis discipulorum TaxID=1119528 RepID=UPI001A36EBFB|nr:HisA/HisF-related TIM barrel protein [Methyloversatilis discipulorum]MBL8469318.1 histidine biosynthesis protein [Methyloversatilis discipulorum]
MPELIPVIDLMQGRVVHARRGDRQAYQPLRSRLVEGCAPADVVDALVAATAARHIYIADLDAIRRLGGDHAAVIAGLAARHPQVEFWVDGGFADAAAALALHRATGATPVMGSESLTEPDALAKLSAADVPALLSLDYRGGVPLGAAWAHAPGFWPTRVIAMELARVGSEAGPELALIDRLRAQRPDVAVIAAGGVRDAADLVALDGVGVPAVLVASALHDGRLAVS